MSRSTIATIDVAALARNVERVRGWLGASKLMAVVKADAYGHGLKNCLPSLGAVDMLAVATLDEARAIRALDERVDVLLLEGVMSARELEVVESLRLEMVVHHTEQLEWIEQAGGPGAARVWLKIDTGMHRLGFPPEKAAEVHARLVRLPGVEEVVVTSHFACADDVDHPLNRHQIDTFDRCVNGLMAGHCLANSAALLKLPEARRDWVRTGLLLYGVSPVADSTGAELGLEPVMKLSTRLIAVNHVAAGEAIGYGARFVAERDSVIGVAAIGYGDGYPRNMPDGAPVLVNGRIQPLVGRVSMDMITVDLSDPGKRPAVGDEVVLWGGDLPVERVAESAGTIPYELVCRVTRRVHLVIENLRNSPRS